MNPNHMFILFSDIILFEYLIDSEEGKTKNNFLSVFLLTFSFYQFISIWGFSVALKLYIHLGPYWLKDFSNMLFIKF